jgi:hypothetical protein
MNSQRGENMAKRKKESGISNYFRESVEKKRGIFRD